MFNLLKERKTIMKTIREKIEIMQAYERGELIENYNHGEWTLCENPMWNWGYADYRVKPKPKYIPFDTPYEFLEAQKEHGVEVKSTNTGVVCCAFVDSQGRVLLVMNGIRDELNHVCKMFDDYVFLDNTPCGKQILTEK